MSDIIMFNLDKRTIAYHNNRHMYITEIDLADPVDIKYVLNDRLVYKDKIIEYMSRLDKNDLIYKILSFCLEINGGYKTDDHKEISICDGNFNSVNKIW